MAIETEVRRARAAVVRIVDREDTTTVLGPRGALRFEGGSAALLRAVLDIHGEPVTRSELFAALAMRPGIPVHEGTISELCAILERDGVLIPAKPASRPFAASRRIVLAISGEIAAVDAPALVRGLQAAGCEVRIAMTRNARRFVAVAALEALTHVRVATGIWQQGTVAPHVPLAAWAELVVVWPASATTVARIADGDCSDLVSALVTTTRAPVLVAPSMTDATFASAPVQDHLATLRAHGRWVVHPAHGLEIAQPPATRTPTPGSAPPPAAMLDLVRHVLIAAVPRPLLPEDPAGWEQLWASTPSDQLPWHADTVEPALADALAARYRPGARLAELGTGDGLIAAHAARMGYRVTATDVSPTALGRARARAGALPILFVLDDAVMSQLETAFDVVVDVGLLHCLPRPVWAAYARTIITCVGPRGTLLLVLHVPAPDILAVTDDDLRVLFPTFDLVRTRPTTLARFEARVVELVRRG